MYKRCRVLYRRPKKSRNNNEKKSRYVKYASGVIGVLKCIRINNKKYMYIIYSL